MRTLKQVLLLMVLLAASLPLRADDLPPAITIQCTAISLPKAQALRFTDEHRLDSDAAGGLRDLLKLVEERRAESVANPAITTKNGQVAWSETATTKLKAEPVLTPLADVADVNIEFTYLKKNIATSFTARRGEVKFLGAFDSDETLKNVTYFVFVRVRIPG